MAGRIQIDLPLSRERGAERSARGGLGARQRFVLGIGAVRLMVAMFRPVYDAHPAPPGEAGWIRILTAFGRTLWKPASVTDQIAIPAEALRCNPVKNGSIRTDQNAVQLTPACARFLAATATANGVCPIQGCCHRGTPTSLLQKSDSSRDPANRQSEALKMTEICPPEGAIAHSRAVSMCRVTLDTAVDTFATGSYGPTRSVFYSLSRSPAGCF